MRHGDVILTLQRRHGSTCDQGAADVWLFVFYLSRGRDLNNPSLVLCGERKISTQGLSIFKSGKRGLPSFPLDDSHVTPMDYLTYHLAMYCIIFVGDVTVDVYKGAYYKKT